MHSVLFHLGPLPIHSYGFMLALSFLFGIWFSSWHAKKRGLDQNVVMDVGFYVIISAIVGARLYYVFLHFDEFVKKPLDIVNPFQSGGVGIGGLVMYGGFIGAILATFLYFKVKKAPFLPYADVCAISVGSGIFLTRIGCFLNGCCQGMATAGPLGVHFPADSPAGYYEKHLATIDPVTHAMHTPALFPSQLFESIGGLLIFGIVLYVYTRRIMPGLAFYSVGILYAVLRFAIDFTRYYGSFERVGPLSHNQVVCIVLFVLFGGLIVQGLLGKQEAAAAGPSGSVGEAPASPSDSPQG